MAMGAPNAGLQNILELQKQRTNKNEVKKKRQTCPTR
jgi:hypothetical protein